MLRLSVSLVCPGSWSGSHMKCGQSFRVRHITTGRYLCLDEEKGLMVLDPERANTKLSAFSFRVSKVRYPHCYSIVNVLVVAQLF